MDVMPSSSRYIQQPGTLGTVGTGWKQHELGLAHTRNRRGTLGTSHRQHRAFTRVMQSGHVGLNSICGSVCPVFIRRCVAPSPHLLLMGTGAFESCILQLPLRTCCADFQNGARVSTIVWITTFLRRLQPQRTVIGPVASPALPSVTALLRPLAAPGVCGASALLSHHAGRFRRSASFCHRFWISSLQCRRHPTFRPLLFK